MQARYMAQTHGNWGRGGALSSPTLQIGGISASFHQPLGLTEATRTGSLSAGGVLNLTGGLADHAQVNGSEITGEGNQIELDTATLKADIEFAEGFTGSVDPITVSGGAMTFNFSPDLGSPTMLALPNISATSLGGSAGRLGNLATGGSASLTSGKLSGAIDILDTARDQVLEARARAGAFEKYTIESSQTVLDGMEENISSAMSNIFDTDVAAETSRLVQAQILTDAATSTLMIVGRQRGMVGALLGF